MVPIEIKIPKEIRNYHENIFFGLNTRQFVCSLLALGAAVGLYFCLPFAACGFFSYHGMTAEQLLWAWIKSEILMPKQLVFKSDCLYYQAMQPAIAEGCKRKRKCRPKKHTDKTDDFKFNAGKTKLKWRKSMTKAQNKTDQNQDNPATPEARH